MTSFEMEAAIREESPANLSALLLPLINTKVSKKLAKTVAGMKRSANAQFASPASFLRVASSKAFNWQEHFSLESRVNLAILAFCPWTQARSVPSFIGGVNDPTDYRELIFQILSVRKPDWLERWAVNELEKTARHHICDWGLIHKLVRQGLCPKPKSPQYIIKMFEQQAGNPYRRGGDVLDRLRDDGDLLEDEVWRIFEIFPAQQGLGNSMANIAHCPWAQALAELASEGRLDRLRLLRESLEALNRHVDPRHASWFWRFHESLQPTVDERTALQPYYFKNLAIPLATIVSFALAALAEVAKAQRLDGPGLIRSIAPVFQLRTKAQPLTALRLLKQLATSEPDLKPAVAECAALAVGCEKAEVQKVALDLIESLGHAGAPGCATVLAGQIEALPPSLHERGRRLLQQLQGDEYEPDLPRAEPPAKPKAEDSAAFGAEAESLIQPWRGYARVDEILALFQNALSAELPPVQLDITAIPRCDATSRIKPIEDLDELIEGLSAGLEELKDAVEFERLMDGISRLCDLNPPDFVAQTAPLFERVKEIKSPAGGFWPAGLRMLLAQQIACYCNSTYPFDPTLQSKEFGILSFLWHRMREMWSRINVSCAAPLLGCPTHRPGWIEPMELVRRLRWWQEHALVPDRHDFIQGLLRLAPEGRDQALQEAQDLPGEYAAALRYALGTEREPGAMNLSLHLAAARAQQPFGDLTGFELQPSVEAADGRTAARYSWEIKASGKRFVNDRETQLRLLIEASPEDPALSSLSSRPTMLLHYAGSYSPLRAAGWADIATLRWIGSVWPGNQEAFFAAGAAAVVERHDKTASPYAPHSAYLEPLLDADQPFSEMAQLVLAVSLVSRDADVSGLAVDVLIQAISDGRCAGASLGAIFARLATGALLKCNRLVKGLETVARVSLLHMHVCVQLVHAFLAAITALPADSAQLLAILREWLIALERPLADGARPLLQGIPGTSKGAVIARKLMQHSGQRNWDIWQKIVPEALRGRITRVQQWLARRQLGSQNSTPN